MARVHPAGSPPELAQLGLRLTELTRLLQEDRPGPPVPERVVRVAATVLGDVQDCGLTLVRGSGPPATVAWAGRLSPTVDAIQHETGEGPCLQAGRDGDVVLVEDLGVDRRWPEFARRCVAETGVRSMVSVRLFLSGDDRGALNLYAQRPAAFDDQAVGTAAVIAPFAALALQSVFREQEIAQLHRALRSSRQIGAAVGILMARQQLTSEQAFGRLVTASQHLNRKLRDLAAEVTETGALPVVPRSPPDPHRRWRPRRARGVAGPAAGSPGPIHRGGASRLPGCVGLRRFRPEAPEDPTRRGRRCAPRTQGNGSRVDKVPPELP